MSHADKYEVKIYSFTCVETEMFEIGARKISNKILGAIFTIFPINEVRTKTQNIYNL